MQEPKRGGERKGSRDSGGRAKTTRLFWSSDQALTQIPWVESVHPRKQESKKRERYGGEKGEIRSLRRRKKKEKKKKREDHDDGKEKETELTNDALPTSARDLIRSR